MSEERFDRIESQIAQLREFLEQNMLATQPNVSGIDQNLISLNQNSSVVDQNLISLNQNINALREDLLKLRHRIESVKGAQTLMIREGFKSLMPYNDDLNYDLSDNVRQTRLLKRRMIWLEGKGKED